MMARLAQVQEGLGSDELLWITDPHDLFYFTQLTLSTGTLCVTKRDARLFVDGRYIQAAKEQENVAAELESAEAKVRFMHTCGTVRLLFDGSNTSYDQYQAFAPFHLQLVSDTARFKRLRAVKDAEEIDALKKSAELNWRGFHFICRQLREGVTEKELARAYTLFVLEQGGDALAFPPIIAFGAHSAMPHYAPGDVSLKKGDIVLIDIGVVLNHYCSDLTRVVAFQKAPEGFPELYRIVHEAQKAALSQIRPGARVRALDLAARRVMQKEGVEDLYLHSLGHGVGLEVHEFPRLRSTGVDQDVVLEEGMAITIEPGLYRAGSGGIRYEDTVIVTKTGYENFYPTSDELALLYTQ